ncbi:two component regulator with propeller domain [Natronoflexus pectinivorans]|uniref:histidine kinase n=1 Tax=Natronoflexus pectinivorans TaxID=682526 RepID=A0A4R2GIN6_9BACT|nr:two component regulator with propeller domain [Natronoflexus pectinivorans]
MPLFGIILSESTFSQLVSQQLFFRQLTTDNGLIHNNVYSIAQDRDGFIWFGTENGLQRHDGVDFKTYRYDPGDNNSIPGNVIYAIHKDLRGHLWIATNSGLARYNPAKGNFDRIGLMRDSNNQSEVLYSYYVPALAESADGVLYVSWGNHGIWKHNQKEDLMEPVTIKSLNGDRFSLGNITVMHFDKYNRLWLGSRTQGLFIYCPDKNTTLNFREGQKNSIGSNLIFSINEDKSHRVFVSHNKGLDIYCKTSEKFTAYEPSMSEQPFNGRWIWQIDSDQSGNLWFCSNDDGLHKMIDANLNFRSYFRDETIQGSLNDNNVQCFFEDRQGNKWVGTQRGGVNYVLNSNQSTFVAVQRNPFNNITLSSNRVTALSELNDSIIIIGTDGGGINFFNRNTHRIVSPDEFDYSICNAPDVILTIHVDEKKQIWVGGFLTGIRIYPKGNAKFTTYLNKADDPGALSHNDIRQIYKDSKEKIWITTNGGGLNRFLRDEKRFIHYLSDPSNNQTISSNYSLTIVEDHTGRLWLGTYEGLCRIDPITGEIQRFSESQNLIGEWVYVIYEDSNKEIWVGTNMGLHRFNRDRGVFQNYTSKIALPGEIITGIIEDYSHNLWIATSNGLVKYNPASSSTIHFSKLDGLPGNAFNNGASLRTSDGKLLFGTSEGLVYFDPNKIRENIDLPQIFITEYSHAPETGKRSHINNGEIITLSHHEAASVTFFFSALNFINASKNNYAYKLEGLDKQWNQAGNQKYASYTNLSPGKYLFTVKASNNNNLWNDEGAYIYLNITPPFWRTNVAYLLYSIVIALLLLLIWRYSFLKVTYAGQLKIQRIKAQRAEEIAKMKSDFFINVSHELSTPLSLIIAPVERLLKNEIYDKKMLISIQRNAHNLLNLINELIDTQKTENENHKKEYLISDLNEFIKVLVDDFREKGFEKDISFDLRCESNTLFFRFNPEEMKKALSNLISNAIKYNRQHGHIVIEVREFHSLKNGLHNYIQIIISDTGYGIHPKDLPFIFDRYYRATSGMISKKASHITGFGIGLYNTRKIIEAHNGSIQVNSEEGVGSSFLINLPYDKIFGQSKTPKRSSVKHTIQELKKQEKCGKERKKKKHSVVIAEDNAELLSLLKTIFESDYDVYPAEDGQTALNLATKLQPDIIITDIMMPGINGIELCQRLKSDIYVSHIPIIMLTALNTGDTIVKSYKLGADDYIAKPFNPEVLIVRTKNIIQLRELLKRKFVTEVKAEPSEITFTSKDEIFLSSLVKTIEDNLDNPDLNNEFLSSEMNMTTMTLYRKVKSLTGQSINPFIRTVRLKKAASLLRIGEMTVQEAAFLTGFNDIKYFRKCFQRQFGINPSETNIHCNVI